MRLSLFLILESVWDESMWWEREASFVYLLCIYVH